MNHHDILFTVKCPKCKENTVWGIENHDYEAMGNIEAICQSCQAPITINWELKVFCFVMENGEPTDSNIEAIIWADDDEEDDDDDDDTTETLLQ